MTDEPASYIGRFAPSPTGPLHFGSLLAAVASYAQARTRHGHWLLRIEDIDPPREQPGVDKLILDSLESYGFEWDGPVTYQSSFAAHHEQRVQELLESGLAYPCSCSRKDLAEFPRGPLGIIYPGTCRQGSTSDEAAIRLRTDNEPIEFQDALQGAHLQRLESESGDFIIKRRDGLIAYHLAVVVDDFHQGITEIVRGIDLLDSTPRQIRLQRAFGFPTPDYMHIPVAVNNEGQKLSKLTGAKGIDTICASETLFDALRALRQDPPGDLRQESCAEIWNWALANWQADRLAGQTEIPAHPYGYG